MVVSYFGYSLSLPLTNVQFALVSSQIGPSQSVYLPLIFRILEPYMLNQSGYIYFLHPLALVGWMGTLITFLNAFPIGQLDGGHVARAVLNSRMSKILSYAMTVLIIFMGWWAMALLIIFLIRFDYPGPIDDVSPLSNKRKILAALLMVILILCFTFSPDSPFALF